MKVGKASKRGRRKESEREREGYGGGREKENTICNDWDVLEAMQFI